jgi:beta-glucosidase
VDDFFNYATFVITRYDQYVPIWYTFNEPQYCNWQYSFYHAGNAKGLYPAYHGITGGLKARIACSHYSILAHAKVAKWCRCWGRNLFLVRTVSWLSPETMSSPKILK